MLPPFDGILFDFDGTLAESNLDFADMRRRLHALTLEQGVPPDVFQNLNMLEAIDHVTTWLRHHDAEKSRVYHRLAHQLLYDIEIKTARGSQLLPGIEAMLRQLRMREIALGVVTRNCDAAVRLMFPQIDTYCQAVLARDHVAEVKPHPAHLQAALSRLSCSPERALMMGDGAMDMQAGKSLAMYSIGVLTGTGTRESLIAHGADLILKDATELHHYLSDVSPR